jgi:hypothetical protein
MSNLQFLRGRSAARPLLFAAFLGLPVYVLPEVGSAAQGDCGQPQSGGAAPTSTDCLFILQAGIGLGTCDPTCICDLVGRDGVSASDALVCLQTVVGTDFPFDCPCDTTTTTLPPSLGVEATIEGDALPDATLDASADITLPTGCTLQSVAWTQTSGAAAVIDAATSADTSIVLPPASDYKASLIERLREPPITAEELPPNIPLPEGEFPGGLPDRFQIVGVNPFALEEAELSVFEVTVETSCGTASDTVEVTTGLAYASATGLRNVPIGRPVILIGRAHVDEDENGLNDETGAATTYDWSLAGVPTGSAATLVDATTQTPELTPDLEGVYTVSVTDTTRLPGTDVVTIEIYAGTWGGAISGEDVDGLPLAENCTGCHDGDPAPDQFSTWRETGHAEIFTQLLNTNTHDGPRCWTCHTVGFDPEVDNGGFDDADDYEAFLDAGLVNVPSPDNWSTLLAEFPETASLANVQCESCHGPQSGSGAHTTGAPRTSLSAEVCATCHGEPARHGRFQQWQLSGHANYELAIDEGEDGNCSRCHTSNGFLAWLPVLLDDDPLTDPVDNVTVAWTADEVHPQTCATCHDPHDNGNVSGTDNNARVRISGNTPPLIGGFTALGVGKGAICMTCHNSRRGLRNEDTWPDYVGTSEASRAPHGSVQADVLMGENAYLVNVGIRGNHSFVEGTCVNCHMQRTPPPDDISYNQTGTNHTMYASDEICSQCHGSAFNAAGVQEAFQASFDVLEELAIEGYLTLFEEQIALGNVVVLELGGGVEQVISDVSTIEVLELDEARGGLGLTFTVSGTTVGPLAFASIEIRDGTNTAVCPATFVTCELYLFAEDDLLKSSWNWALVHSDGSQGVHNPSFVLTVLDASIDALER